MSLRKITSFVSAAVLAAWLAPVEARAQTYPERPVSLVVGQAAGGTSDIFARFFAEALSHKFGRIIVENTPGAGGTIAATRVARAAPDGYTFLFGSSGINAIAYSLYKDLAYKPDDFVPVAHVADTTIVIAVKKELGVKTMAEFIALAKAKPDELTMGHTGNGQTTHLVCVLLQQTAGIKLRMVPFRGGGESVNALLAGVTDGACNGTPDLAQNVLSGSVVGLGVGSAERIELIPDTPSAIDLGLPGMVAPVWLTIFAPKGTPKAIVDKLNAALQEAMNDPSLAKRLASVGSSLAPKSGRTVEAAEKLVASDIRRWAEVMQKAGVGKSQ
ncbi:tripartite tricarboxylate transporter substrate binding protein [Enterovirga sp.]|uniref:Bug family tripartite tricarboxylate transporter substrate binding protein n=1 Tax=Enterovirga sp. TaxID=2026350 RepID=UPI00263A0573|nr:tripartite tricarboxylate transporter substrate binding protein [Enterovirga sp.]MDB5592988.1 hypothetical protein [Enterovirga sp.]